MTTTVLTLDSKRWYDPNSSSYKTSGEMKVGYDAEGSSQQIRCSYRFILPVGYADLFITSAILALTVDADTHNYGYGTDTIIGPHDGTTAFNSIDLSSYATVNILNPKGIEDNYMGWGRDYTVTQGTISVVNVDLTTAINAAITAGKIDNGGINLIWDQQQDWYGYDLFSDNNVSPTLTLNHIVPPDPSPYGLGDETVLYRGATLGTDLGPYENDGTLVGGLTSVVDTDEQGTDAFDMDGVDNKLVVNTFSTDTDWTVAAWVKINSGNQKGCWIKCGADTDDNGGWGVGIGGSSFDNTGRKLVFLKEGVTWHPTSYTFSNNQWYHIAVTRDGNVNRIYVDGVQKYTNTLSSNAAGDKTTFGGYVAIGTYNRHVPNRMDDCCQFSRALSIGEIAQLASKRNYDHPEPTILARYQASTASADDTVGSFDGIFRGDAAVVTDTGHGGTHAFAFDGTGDYIEVPDLLETTGTLGDKTFSASLWFKANSTTADGHLLNNSASGYAGLQLGFHASQPNKLYYGWYSNDGGYASVRGWIPFSSTAWTHLAVTYNGSGTFSGLKIYVNGEEESLTDASESSYIDQPSNSTHLGIGGRVTGAYRFNGRIDDVIIYEGILSETLVETLYTNGPDGSTVAPVEGEATITLDDVVMSASGASSIAGDATITLDDVVASSRGTQLSILRASATITLDDVTTTSDAALISESISTITLDDVSMFAIADLIAGAVTTIALDDVSMVGSGESIVESVGSIILDDVSMAAAGDSTVAAESTIVLDNITLSSGSQTSVNAMATIVLDDIELSIDVPSNNNVAIVLDDVTMAAIGSSLIGASATIVLDDISATIIASIPSLTALDVIFPNDLFPGDLFITEIFV